MPEAAEDLGGLELAEIALLEEIDTSELAEGAVVRWVVEVLSLLVMFVVLALGDVPDFVTAAELADIPDASEVIDGRALEDPALLEIPDAPWLEEPTLGEELLLLDTVRLLSLKVLDIPAVPDVRLDPTALDMPVFVSPGVLILLDPRVFEDEPVELAFVPLLTVEGRLG